MTDRFTKLCRGSIKVFTLFLFLISLSSAVFAAKKIEKITEIEGITEYRLKNGLTVLLFPDPTKETVTVNMTYKVGSKHESYGETGMAHLLEHLLFKGSKRHKDIPSELSAHGAESNGTTWIDRTNYYETFSATEENIDWALDLEADRMVNSFIAREDLDSEMTVVRNEFERSENSPLRVLMQKMKASAFMWHNNGKPTIGARSDIENVSIKRLQDFYKKYYQPDNAVLTVAGKFDEKALVKKIAKKFGRISRPKRNLEDLYTIEPAQSGEKSVTVRRVGDIQWYGAAYHIPAGSHPDYAAIEVLSQVLGDTPRGRLHKQLVEKKLGVSAFAFSSQLHEPGIMFAFAKVDKSESISKAREALLSTVEGSVEQPFTEDELEMAKRSLLTGYEMAFNSSESIAIHLSEYIGMGDWRLLFLTRDRIEAVTLEDLQRVSQSYLLRNNRTEGYFLPTEGSERVVIPLVEDIPAMLEGYKGRKRVAQGEAFEPSFDNIESRTVYQTLSLGTQHAKAAFLPKKSRGETVAVKMNIQFGAEKALKNKKVIGNLTGQMLMRGSKHYNRDQLQNKLDELKASVNIGGGVSGTYVSIETVKSSLVDTLALVAEVLKTPAFDEHEFQLLKSESIASLESSRQEPNANVFREMRRFYNPFDSAHPRYTHTLDEALKVINDITIDEVKDFYKRFYGANQLQVSIVGDFEPNIAQKVIEQTLGHWLSKESYHRVPHPYQKLKQINKIINTPDKDSSAMVAMLPLSMGDADADAAALEVGVYMFGGGFLNSRLAKRLRGEEGLCYSVSAWLSLSASEARGEFSAYAIFAPQNTAAVELGFMEELEKAVRDGFSAEELSAAKSGLLQKARVARAQDAQLSNQLADNLFLGRTMKWSKQYEQAIETLTVDRVNSVFKRMIDPKQMSFVTAGDVSKTQ